MKNKITAARKSFKKFLKRFIQLECIPYYNNTDNTMREYRILTIFGHKILSGWESITQKKRPTYLS